MRSPVGKLSSVVGGVYAAPENLQELAVADYILIIIDDNALPVVGAPSGNLFVCRVLRGTAAVTGYNFRNAHQLFEWFFKTPETAAREYGGIVGFEILQKIFGEGGNYPAAVVAAGIFTLPQLHSRGRFLSSGSTGVPHQHRNKYQIYYVLHNFLLTLKIYCFYR